MSVIRGGGHLAPFGLMGLPGAGLVGGICHPKHMILGSPNLGNHCVCAPTQQENGRREGFTSGSGSPFWTLGQGSDFPPGARSLAAASPRRAGQLRPEQGQKSGL